VYKCLPAVESSQRKHPEDVLSARFIGRPNPNRPYVVNIGRQTCPQERLFLPRTQAMETTRRDGIGRA